jgi:GT2 family glycosyltransferase
MTSMTKRKITASIVLYKTSALQVETVIKSYSPSKDKILYVIDNSPNISEKLAKINNDYIKYHFVGKNIGYGSAQNIGMKKAIKEGSDFHVILNPDIKFEPTIIDKLADFVERNPKIVEVMPKIISREGEVQHLCKLLPTPFDLIARRFIPKNNFTEKINDQYILKNSGYDKTMNIPCLSGCFMFLRIDTIKKHNLFFDERFFMYCEDFDFTRRLHFIGETLFYPDVSVIHDHAKESYKSSKMLIEHIKSAIKYFMKWGWFFDKERKTVNIECLKRIKDLL